MSIYNYEAAFGAADITSLPMRKAIARWFDAYYGAQGQSESDPCQRIPCAVVSRITRTVFSEYTAAGGSAFAAGVLAALDQKRKQALQLALVGGACYLKPCLTRTGFSFALIPRNNVLIFARDTMGQVTDMGTVERTVVGNHHYTLLERRRRDADGLLTVENTLYRSGNDRSLGTKVALNGHPAYGRLLPSYRFSRDVGMGLVEMRTPMVNCVDGTAEPVSVYAPAMDLMDNLDRNEAQMNGEFQRGQSRIILSADMLRDGALQDNLFVGLDEDPQAVGMTVFAPQLREGSYLARKQEYLRNIESLIGLKRGSLSDANEDQRTATEITASGADFSLTVADFRGMWEEAVKKTLQLCGVLGELYGFAVGSCEVRVDWGNGVLYDQDKTWEQYRQMVADGLLRPEVALGWRFHMPARTEGDFAAIRQRFMPQPESAN